MGFAKKCDICGKLYEVYGKEENPENFNAFMLLNVDEYGTYYSNDHFDVCTKCRDSLKKWMDERRK